VLGVCGSAAISGMTCFIVGVASDFRYGYWAVLAALAASVVAASGRPARNYFAGPDEALQAL
jgi:hypothetical protein